MAHFFVMLPPQSSVQKRSNRSTHDILIMDYAQPKRSDSMYSSDSNASPTSSNNSTTVSRSNSASGVTIRTWSCGPGAVRIERVYESPSNRDIVLVPIRLKNQFRISSIDGAEELPGRPAPRSFLRRLCTRISPSFDNAAAREERYQIVKMPREEYHKFFKRDRYGNFAGSEHEREWDEEDLKREYAAYQDAPLGGIFV